MTGRQALAAVLRAGQGAGERGSGGGHRALRRRRRRAAERGGRAVAAEPDLPRTERRAHRRAGRSEISPDLLAGSHATILANFYERSLADQPAAVRRIIEDELLTASGFRENVAEERLVAASRAAGAGRARWRCWSTAGCCASRSGSTCGASNSPTTCCAAWSRRAATRARSARSRDAARAPAGRAARERGRRAPALVRARQVAAVCAAAGAGCRGGRVLAVLSTQRARRAEAATQQARVQAEGLLGYLSDDFVART